MSLIKLENVSKVYRMGETKVQALKNINLKIEKGENVVIIGPSGCGKSTLLHLMGCLDRPTKGKVLIDGRDVSKLSDNELAKIRREKIGFIFQFFYLIPTLTALENVMLPMTFAGVPSKEKIRRAKELLKLVGLERRMYHKRSELSGGEIQRVAIARALANDPEIILADEPTGNLDSKSGKEVIKYLVRLNKEKNVTLVVVTHDLSIVKFFERKIYLKDGQIIKEESS
ncbi:MAG TPA: ABC transporter ATP-binding protein [Candidatus Aenigmarchaeota archaeon]|nr:ABC transporter ATP-binding protein [Candidatus Aenigmarchaeota archaeon]